MRISQVENSNKVIVTKIIKDGPADVDGRIQIDDVVCCPTP